MRHQRGRQVPPKPHDDLLVCLKEHGLRTERLPDGWCWYWKGNRELYEEMQEEDPAFWEEYRDDFLATFADTHIHPIVGRGVASEGAAAVDALDNWMHLEGVHDTCTPDDAHFAVLNAANRLAAFVRKIHESGDCGRWFEDELLTYESTITALGSADDLEYIPTS